MIGFMFSVYVIKGILVLIIEIRMDGVDEKKVCGVIVEWIWDM